MDKYFYLTNNELNIENKTFTIKCNNKEKKVMLAKNSDLLEVESPNPYKLKKEIIYSLYK